MKISIKFFLIVSSLSITISSCLKDNNFENGTIQSGSNGSGGNIKVISLGVQVSNSGYSYTDYNGNDATYPDVQFLQQAYPLTSSDTTLGLVPVELGGTSDATQDIHVTVSEDTSLVVTYDDSTGSDFVNPGSTIQIISNIVVIPKGSRVGYLQVKFKISDLLNADYAYGFKITSVAESGYTISGNLSQAVVAIGPKNQYDGVYKSAGEFIHPAYGDLVWDYSKGYTQSLVTTGLNSVYTTPINTTVGAFGVELDITVNPDNTLTEVFNGNPTPMPNSDHYDPATRTFYVSGSYQGASGTRSYHATYVYKGSR